jgi:hypothetical protein
MKNKIKFSNDRNFGITASILLSIVYFLSLDDFIIVFNNYILASIIILIISIIKPNLLNLLNFLTFKIGLAFMRLVSSINIFIIYFLIFGIVGIFMKIFNYDPLFLNKNKKLKTFSFWHKRKSKYDDLNSMKNQF